MFEFGPPVCKVWVFKVLLMARWRRMLFLFDPLMIQMRSMG